MASRQFYQTSSTGESTTAETSYQDKATLTFTPDANSTYLLLATWLQGQASANRVSYVQLYDATGSATLNEQVVNQNDANDYIPGGCAIHVSFGSSPSEQTYKVQYRTGGTANAKIKQVRLIAIKLGSNDQTSSSTARSTYATDTSLQDKVSKTFTPGSAGDYLILASAVYDASRNTYDATVQIDVDGSTQYGSLTTRVTTSANRHGYLYFQKVTLTAASHTIKIRYATANKLSTVGIAYAYLTLLRLSDFEGIVSASQDSEQSDTDGTKDHALTADFSSAAAKDHLILACGLQKTASTIYGGSVGLYEGTSDLGTDRIVPQYTGKYYPYFGSYYTTDPADTYYVDVQTENASYATGVDDIRIYGLQLTAAVQNVTSSDSLLLKLGTESVSLAGALAASDSLLVKQGESIGLTATAPPGTDALVLTLGSDTASLVAGMTGTDPLLMHLGADVASLSALLTGVDTLSLTLGSEPVTLIASIVGTDNIYVLFGTESGAKLGATELSASDTLLLTLAESSPPVGLLLAASDTMLMKMSESAGSVAGTMAASDTLLMLFGEVSQYPTASITGSDTLPVTLGTETSVLAALLAAADTLLLTYTPESAILTATVPAGSDTITIALNDLSAAVSAILVGTDPLSMTVADASQYPAGLLAAADTLLLKLGTETAPYPPATILGIDPLLIDPAIEAFDLIASLTALDTLILASDWDLGGVGNLHGACEAITRRIHAKARITYSDPSLSEAIEVSSPDGSLYGTSTLHTADNVQGSPYKWASLQENVLDGTYHPMGDSVGWWSNTLSDTNGEFSPGLVLLVTMTDVRPIYDLKLIGDNQFNNYPVDFVIKLYDEDDVLLYTETVTGNDTYAWTKTLDDVVNGVKKMEVTITKISLPNRSAMVTEFFTAYSEDYGMGDILYLSVLEERDFQGGTLPVGNVSSNELVLRLNNITNHFSVDNVRSPIYNMMKKNRRIEVWVAIEVPLGTPPGDSDWEPLGVFWSQDWSVPQDETYAEVVAFDRLELLRKTEFYSEQIYVDYTLKQLAELVFADAGVLSTDYVIHSSLNEVVIPYAWFGRTTHRDALVEIAEAIMGTVYCDRYGRIVITPYVNAPATSYTLSADRYFTKDNPLAFSEIVNYVEVQATPRSPGTQEVIYSDTESLVVPGAVDGVNGEAERWCIFNASDPCIDVQTATGTATGGTITLKSQVDYSWATLLTYQNTNVEAGTVTDIEIQGKVLGTTGEKVAIAQDAASIRLNGKQSLREPVRNEFIQTKARAQAIADGILAAYKDPRRDVVVQARGYIMSKLAERMTVKSLDGSTENDYTITRQHIEYDGGLTVEMSGTKVQE
jgi:hypothetical protein